MSNPRTPITELELTGSPNLGRALKRANEDAPLTPAQRGELEQIDDLIQRALAACRRGQVVKGKRNPAFANLAILVRLRQTVSAGRDPEKKSTQELLAEVDRLLTGAN